MAFLDSAVVCRYDDDAFFPDAGIFHRLHDLSDIAVYLFQLRIISRGIMPCRMAYMIQDIEYDIYQCRFLVFDIIDSETRHGG